MGKFLTRKNIGWVLAIGMCAFLMLGFFGKMFGSEENIIKDMGASQIISWMRIIAAGELVCIILFLIPKTMKLGTILLSAYFGGAIMMHMANPDPAHQSFIGPSVFLILTWVISWIRGNELIDLKGK